MISTCRPLLALFFVSIFLGSFSGCGRSLDIRDMIRFRVLRAGEELRSARTEKEWDDSRSHPDSLFAEINKPGVPEEICESFRNLTNEDLMIFIDQIEDPHYSDKLPCRDEVFARLQNYIEQSKREMSQAVEADRATDPAAFDGAEDSEIIESEIAKTHVTETRIVENHVVESQIIEPDIFEMAVQEKPEPIVSVSDLDPIAPIPPAQEVPENKQRSEDFSENPHLADRIQTKVIPISVFDTKTLIRGDLPKGEIMLTFDDGPNTKSTVEILNTLNHENIKATFYHVGKRALANPEIVRQIQDAGHVVGSHSWDHEYELNKIQFDKARRQIMQGHQAVEAVLAGPSYFFRFPYGAQNAEVRDFVRERELINTSWNMDPLDWKYTDPKRVLQNCLYEIDREGSGILLLHDIKAQTAAMLPFLIKALKTRAAKTVIFDANHSGARLNRDNTRL